MSSAVGSEDTGEATVRQRRGKIWFNQIIVSCASEPNGKHSPVLRLATSNGIFYTGIFANDGQIVSRVTKISTSLAEVPTLLEFIIRN